ncbi:uncharacterized protein LOC107645551 [Arachis ipaensis]|uniref:uncharacterized protein LOC107645551 n=1 Tax=Arachis ipaensis TaxID=130454 RepID=UPI0007AF8DCF|nr:uncharacterized protein LOC107645551 [Arachis ipaensis]
MSLTKERSPRVSPQEEDLMNHSTKKVKTHNDAELGDNVNRIQPAMDVELGNENQQSSLTTRKVSYKDSLVALGNSSMAEDDIDENDPNSEDKWYKDKESNGREEKPFDLCPVIPVSKEEFEEWCKPWQAALIVKVLGKRVNLGFIEHRLNRDWERKSKINVIDMDRDYFLVHFTEEEDYSHALLGGPWMVAGHYLIVQRWRPFFLESEKAVKKVAAWVRIPNLPIELYNHRFLWRVGYAIGTMLKVDRTTSIHFRGKFARICVEIDLTKKLVPRISILGAC